MNLLQLVLLLLLLLLELLLLLLLQSTEPRTRGGARRTSRSREKKERTRGRRTARTQRSRSALSCILYKDGAVAILFLLQHSTYVLVLRTYSILRATASRKVYAAITLRQGFRLLFSANIARANATPTSSITAAATTTTSATVTHSINANTTTTATNHGHRHHEQTLQGERADDTENGSHARGRHHSGPSGPRPPVSTRWQRPHSSNRGSSSSGSDFVTSDHLKRDYLYLTRSR